jgi:hypothetical protein
VQYVRAQQKQYLISFGKYGLQHSAFLSASAFLSFAYISSHISFLSSVIWCGLSLQRSERLHATGCTNVFDPAALIYTVLNLRSVTPCNPNFEEVQGYLQNVWVTLKVKVYTQMGVTTTQNALWQSNKTKKFTLSRFLLKQTFWSFLYVFLYCIRT